MARFYIKYYEKKKQKHAGYLAKHQEDRVVHMADSLISPAVGGVLWAASAGLVAHCSKKLKEHLDGDAIPLMGVLGAFIFAAQMINFTIPATGSSGHLGGALLLSILLGPYAAFLTIASVLTVQSLFFADGGLLALGCNVFNLGFFPCFVAYPFVYRPLVGAHPTQGRIMMGAVLASVIGLQLGSLGVVLETLLSGVSELPFSVFVTLMQPIHLAIGIVEGFVTAVVALFVWQARPELLHLATPRTSRLSMKGVLGVFVLLACLTGGVLSLYASEHPDGLEWAMTKTSGKEELVREGGIYGLLAQIQEATAFLPDYGFHEPEAAVVPAMQAVEQTAAMQAVEQTAIMQTASAGTSLSGIVGGVLTLLLAGCAGMVLRRRKAV